MTMSSDLSVLTQTIVDLLEDQKESLKLHDVFYGDQQLIPFVPAATVEANNKVRSYNQTGLHTNVDISIFITVYHGKVQDRQITQKEIDERVQAVEAALHQNTKLTTTANPDGYVINGLVSAVESGVAQKGRELFLAHRLTWTAIVKERIGV